MERRNNGRACATMRIETRATQPNLQMPHWRIGAQRNVPMRFIVALLIELDEDTRPISAFMRPMMVMDGAERP